MKLASDAITVLFGTGCVMNDKCLSAAFVVIV